MVCFSLLIISSHFSFKNVGTKETKHFAPFSSTTDLEVWKYTCCKRSVWYPLSYVCSLWFWDNAIWYFGVQNRILNTINPPKDVEGGIGKDS